MAFSELIKKFDKIIDYMRDFYIYGFKSRMEFNTKSARTYDNEKRRIESYMGKYMKWEYFKGSKTSFISVDCSKIPVNPLYSAWKAKSFTANDIMLHFYILDALQSKSMPIDLLTDYISEKSETVFDAQTVRNKCNEYVKNGMLLQKKQGKAFVYAVNSQNIISENLLDAIKFFQGTAPFGEIGSYILDTENADNDLFAFKHYYIAHTLENQVLFDLLSAIRQERTVILESHNKRKMSTVTEIVLPLKIFVSAGTGRRFVCVYLPKIRRFQSFRLDYIKTVLLDDKAEYAKEMRERLDNNLDKTWGVSFGSKYVRLDIICMKLFIDEAKEQYVIDRIAREGMGGELLRIDENIFLYTKEMFDSSAMSPWIKTFTGRILQLEGANKIVVNRFYDDMECMAKMYEVQ